MNLRKISLKFKATLIFYLNISAISSRGTGSVDGRMSSLWLAEFLPINYERFREFRG